MRIGLITAVTLLSSLSPALAQERLFIGSAEVSGHRSRYAQAGVIVPLPGSTLGNGYVVRGVAHALSYQYQGRTRIDADAAGAELALGYQGSGEGGWWGASTGPLVRYTDLSPSDPGSDARGTRISWLVQAEGERHLTPDIKAGLIGNYAFGANDAYWSRLRLLHRISGAVYAGPEGILQGDEDYNAWQVGAGVFGIALSPGAELGVKAGARKVEKLSTSAYVGVELGYSF